MRIELPDFCLVTLIGASGSGKSHFAARHFAPTEILESDAFRAMICDDSTSQEASGDAFDCLYNVAEKRLKRRKLTVIDATHTQRHSRGRNLELAKKWHSLSCAIVFNIPETVCQKRNGERPERHVPPKAISRQCHELAACLADIKKEGFHRVFVINSATEDIELARVPLWTDLRGMHGPFDIIGDPHGCYAELCELLKKLGYEVRMDACVARPPEGRKAIFLGDLGDRGPNSAGVFQLVMNMAQNGDALCVQGNHDEKLLRCLEGKKARMNPDLARTLGEVHARGPAFCNDLREFLRSLPSHYVLDSGRLVVAHAGLKEEMHGRASGAVRSFCLYGDVDGSRDELGLPVRGDWISSYRGAALVAYGHSPRLEQRFVNNTICLDGGSAFGGSLAALRYPEMEVKSVPARREYCKPLRPLTEEKLSPLPEFRDIIGPKSVATSLWRSVHLDEASTLAAMESMGRFAVDPRWLIYLPPTMAPCASSELPEYLEHPAEAFQYYARHGINKLVCEEKHMGSRANILVLRKPESARRFALQAPLPGKIWSRAGRPFFTGADAPTESLLLAEIREALEQSAFWETFQTDWVLLDCEILPWSLKARQLIEKQYSPAGHAGKEALAASLAMLRKLDRKKLCDDEGTEFDALLERLQRRQANMEKYDKVWRSWCQPVRSPADIRIAPFHILASEGKVWKDVGNLKQLELLESHLGAMPAFQPTRHLVLDARNRADWKSGIEFWHSLTDNGAEGMVVKPGCFTPIENGRLLQPALKCRGREYLRIIYGPGYADRMEDFKIRSLTVKRRRALQEFALGQEALQRFVHNEPLHRVHECVFGILALESEPVDIRL